MTRYGTKMGTDLVVLSMWNPPLPPRYMQLHRGECELCCCLVADVMSVFLFGPAVAERGTHDLNAELTSSVGNEIKGNAKYFIVCLLVCFDGTSQ